MDGIRYVGFKEVEEAFKALKEEVKVISGGSIKLSLQATGRVHILMDFTCRWIDPERAREMARTVVEVASLLDGFKYNGCRIERTC